MENETFDEVLRCLQNDIVHFVGKPVKHSRDLLEEYHERFKAAHSREMLALQTQYDVLRQNFIEENRYVDGKFKMYSESVWVRGKDYFPTESVCRSCARHGYDGKGHHCTCGNIPRHTMLACGVDCKDHLQITGVRKGGVPFFFPED